MVGIDTNILVRYIARDDAKQLEMVDRFVDGLTAGNQGYVSLAVHRIKLGARFWLWVKSRTNR